MSDFTFRDATAYSFEQLATHMTDSFAGYFYPTTMTAPQAADFWRIEQVDATRSVVMRDASGAFIGMAWIATRGERGCCAAFGVVPAFRGRGAGKLLAAEMMRRARASGLARMQIEVLTQNAPAIAVYQGVGFRTRHRLIGMEVAVADLPGDASLAVERAPFAALLSALVPPQPTPWEGELPSLLVRRLEAVVRRAPDGTVTGLAFERHESRIILRAAALPATTTASEFAGWVRAAADGASTFVLHNEIDGNAIVAHCRTLGARETFSQHEMSADL